MSVHDLENGRIIFYTDDFLDSDDVSDYRHRNDDFPAILKINDKYYRQPRVDKRKHQIDEKDIRGHIENVPLELYSFWQERLPGERTGLAAICHRGKWYLAVRTDDRYVGRNDFGEVCEYVDFCRLARLKTLCDRDEFNGCIFLYSSMRDAPPWPPNGARLWCLFPVSRLDDEDDMVEAARLLSVLPCKKRPDQCDLFAYFKKELGGTH